MSHDFDGFDATYSQDKNTSHLHTWSPENSYLILHTSRETKATITSMSDS